MLTFNLSGWKYVKDVNSKTAENFQNMKLYVFEEDSEFKLLINTLENNDPEFPMHRFMTDLDFARKQNREETAKTVQGGVIEANFFNNEQKIHGLRA